MKVPLSDLKEVMGYNGEIELFYKDDRALLEPDYRGKWNLSFSSNPDKVMKFDGYDDVTKYDYNGHSLFDGLVDYYLS
ncbi:hypothetical protein [Limosilactobacillus gorillae]|uniref:hypothetical protein n=1 Tax=Limosilactobacillus gorillae TaxID=1450649 RepID=UPI000A925141|nr:hypothetical protein [Limosilactobacillus gorillae]